MTQKININNVYPRHKMMFIRTLMKYVRTKCNQANTTKIKKNDTNKSITTNNSKTKAQHP